MTAPRVTRPAETVGAAGSTAVFVAYLLGLDETTALHIAAVVGFVPYLLTRVIDAGGLKNITLRLWRGRDPS